MRITKDRNLSRLSNDDIERDIKELNMHIGALTSEIDARRQFTYGTNENTAYLEKRIAEDTKRLNHIKRKNVDNIYDISDLERKRDEMLELRLVRETELTRRR